MAQIKDDTDNSVFDWGFSRDSVNKGSSTRSDEASGSKDSGGPSSRYDPKAMSRIVDITDLVDESDDADSDDDDVMGKSTSTSPNNNSNGAVNGGGGVNNGSNNTNPKKKKNKRNNHPSYKCGLLCRQTLILVALVGIIVAASIAIGYTVINVNGNNNAASPTASIADGLLRATGTNSGEQQLLEIAERVISACSESKLDEDMSECQGLCHASMCCFEKSGSEYSCEEDQGKNCAVYVGCEALVEGVLLGGAEEDED